MGSCAAPSAKGDDKFITTDYLQQCLFVKDLGLVNDTARALTFPLPLATTALNMFTSASNAGFGREDDSAVIKIFNGITLPGHKQ
ncbi:NAD-binding protein, partial [Serratia marcescens]|uniref:NAD-binding protein n=1 Tax=Serratia marcescens TaxID=615 RepID=UPI003F4268D4